MKKAFSRIFGEDVSILRVTIMFIIMGTLIVSFYYTISKRLSANEEDLIVSDELNIVLTQDFENNYPQSPKEVVRWYNRIITLFYSRDLKNKEVEKLCDQARMLMDRDLLSTNPRDNYVASVKQDIVDYKNRSRKIMASDEGASNDVKYTVVDGYEMATVVCRYTIQENNMFSASFQTYMLRRDGAGKYKILTYALTDEKGNPI